MQKRLANTYCITICNHKNYNQSRHPSIEEYINCEMDNYIVAYATQEKK
jgi:hypothetical protein